MDAHLKAGPYQLFMLGLCVYALLALGAVITLELDASTRTILDVADFGICIVFFGDFAHSLIRAPRKWDYLFKWGWIDLASSIPAIDALRWGRAARIARILRVLRGARSTKILLTFILERRAESAFLAACLASVLLIVFSSIAVLQFETDAASNITSAEAALWWAFVTITTVGYGDKFPVTSEGRILAALLMAAGVGLFGTLTGLIASWFLAAGEQGRAGELEAIHSEIETVKRLLIARQREDSD